MDNQGVIITPWDNMCVDNNINRIAELNCWIKGIIGVVMSFILVGTCLHYSLRLVNVCCIHFIRKSFLFLAFGSFPFPEFVLRPSVFDTIILQHSLSDLKFSRF